MQPGGREASTTKPKRGSMHHTHGSKGQAMQLYPGGVYEPYGLQTLLSKKKSSIKCDLNEPHCTKKKQSPCFLSILVLDEEEQLIKLDLEVSRVKCRDMVHEGIVPVVVIRFHLIYT